MHVEIQVALNFFISFLYNKLPRRRVNQFGEELERALKLKFQGHWYPEKPFKGSAFRCIKTAPPLDPVFDVAAQESGMALADIQENLPEELSIWIDPGEVSYRLGEKGVVKILYSESESSEDRADREIYRTFNPEAQCFKPIIAAAAAAHAAVTAVTDGVAGPVTSQLGSMSLSNSRSTAATTPSSNTSQSSSGSHSSANSPGSQSSSSSPYGNSPSPTYKSSPSPINNGFLAKSTAPLTFTTATFAQTKFGSTKLKTNGKRCHRMSPTEFSSYIKQRALIQQQQQQQHHQPHQQQLFANIAAQQHHHHQQQQQQRPRSLSPTPANAATNACIDANSFQLLLASAASANVNPGFAAAPNQFSPRSPHGNGVGSNLFDSYLGDIFSNAAAVATASQPSGLFANNNNNANKMINGQQRQSNNLSAANALSLFFDNKTILNNNSNPSSNSGSNGIAATSASPVIANTNNANFNNGISNSIAENVTNTVTTSANKSFSAVDNTLNFNGISYPNQHLLVAN